MNHEARKITLTWACSHGIEICGDPLFPRLSLPFNPIRDILYVSADLCDEIYVEPYIRSFEEDMIDLTHGTFNEDDQDHLLTKEISRHLTPEFIASSPSIREIRLVLAVRG